MIEADSSAKRIVLPERADAIRPALDAMAAGYFDYSEWGPTWREDEVVSVVKFFQKYDCRTGLNQVEQFVRTRCEGFDEVLPRLIAAIYLKRDDLCADLIEQYPNDFTFLNLGRDNSSLPFEQFTLLPIRYYYAIAKANPSNTYSKRAALLLELPESDSSTTWRRSTSTTRSTRPPESPVRLVRLSEPSAKPLHRSMTSETTVHSQVMPACSTVLM